MPEQHGLGAEECSPRRVTDAMIRLPFGLEEARDLIADLSQALR